MANTTNWLNISATSGSSGETILTLSANKNLSLYDKRAEITAYNPVYNISAKTYVTIQSFAPIIELSPAIIGVPDTGGTFELNISANCAWVISFPDLVTSYSTSAGTGNATVTLTVPGTSADTTLVGNIVVTAEGGQMSKTARIEQYGQGVQLSVSHSEILFPDSGAVRYFTVTANCVYDVSVVSGDDWAVVSPQSGYTGVSSFTVTVDGTNTGTTTREGIVRISAPGVTRYIMLYQNPKETRLTAYYNATSTTNPTELYEVGTGFSKAETPDGTVIPGDSYIFPDTGSNRVFYTMTGTSIPANTFSGMSALTSVVIPDNITTIGEGAFRDCVNLTSVTIPDTVTVLPDNCFNGCSSLTAIPISESVTYIGGGCFAGCTGIETVTIPTGVTGIGAGCFSGSGVETIYANSPTPATIGNGAFTSGNLQDIIVPCALFDAYKTAWSAYEEYMSCQDDEQLYFTTDTSNVKGTGETRTITILNTNIIQNRIGLTLPSDFPSQGAYVVEGNVIYLTYPANPSSTSTRTWTITVRATTKSGKDLSGSYRITQNANVVYSIPYTADTSTVAASGETRTITIDTSNLDPSTISIGIDGATGVSYTYDNGVITLVFSKNNTSSSRNINVTVTGQTLTGDGAYASIPYAQKKREVYDIPYTADTSPVDASGETRNIIIDTTDLIASSITVGIEGATGVTYTYNNGVITVVFQDNSGPGKHIIINVSAETFDGDTAIAAIGYEQEGSSTPSDYLTFNIINGGTISWQRYGQIDSGNPGRTIQYSKNEDEWISITSNKGPSTPSITVEAGDNVRFRGDNISYSRVGSWDSFQSSGATFSLDGNIMSLVDSTGFSTANTLETGYTFRGLFNNCTGLTSALRLLLPATSLTEYCYEDMFNGCTSLTATPLLSATTLANYCYYGMFNGCTSLTGVPSNYLPATTLAEGCYRDMFNGCTSLTGVPSNYLPATTLAEGCYRDMFNDCTSLTVMPTLPATTMAVSCYAGMFSNCTSLTGVSSNYLPATTLADGCYSYMFYGCTGLTAAPDLPATVMVSDQYWMHSIGCYNSMFAGCKSLTRPPALPATTLTYFCYANMFMSCTSLIAAPALPATTLAENCYQDMFWGCTSLTSAPELPATTLVDSCYGGMFWHCKRLNYIKCLATDISAYNCTSSWVGEVASSGTFVKNPSMSSWPSGMSGIPSGWTVQNAT